MFKFHILGLAESYYRFVGYNYVDTPWEVNIGVINETLPPDATPLLTGNGEYALVGSAEQGFIAKLANSRFTKDGSRGIDTESLFFSAGPCFRPNDVTTDGKNVSEFLKMELCTLNNKEGFARLARDAQLLFQTALGEFVLIEETDIGFDLVDKVFGIELGSFGERKLSFTDLKLQYCTGVAVERLLYVGKKYNLSEKEIFMNLYKHLPGFWV